MVIVPPPALISLVSPGAQWKYLDTGTDEGTAWAQPGFADGAWLTGRAQLGYGDSDEATVVRSTRPDSTRIITTYFRHVFTVEDASRVARLAVRLLVMTGRLFT